MTTAGIKSLGFDRLVWKLLKGISLSARLNLALTKNRLGSVWPDKAV